MTSPQTASHKVGPGLCLYSAQQMLLSLNSTYVCVCCCVLQRTRCSHRAAKCRQLKTSWTSTGILRGPVQTMELLVGLPTMAQEVNTSVYTSKHIVVYTLSHLSTFLSVLDLCGEDGGGDSMQNISTDDLPDSASQTAQQHDSKFSFRSLSGW